MLLGWLIFLASGPAGFAAPEGVAEAANGFSASACAASAANDRPDGMAAADPASADPAPALQSLRDRIRGGGILHAGFESRYTDGFTSESSSRSGRLWLADGAYRIETDAQILVVKGRVSTVLDLAENRFLISDYDPEEDDFAPSRFLDASETMTETQSRSGRRTVVTLSSDDPFALWLEIRIVLDARGLPVTISGRDQGDNVIDTDLTDVGWLGDAVTGGVAGPPGSGGGGREGSSTLFTLTPPEGVEIIDLRANAPASTSASRQSQPAFRQPHHDAPV